MIEIICKKMLHPLCNWPPPIDEWIISKRYGCHIQSSLQEKKRNEDVKLLGRTACYQVGLECSCWHSELLVPNTTTTPYSTLFVQSSNNLCPRLPSLIDQGCSRFWRYYLTIRKLVIIVEVDPVFSLKSEQSAVKKFKSLVDQRVHGDQTILQSAIALFPLSSALCRTARNPSCLQTRNSSCHRACNSSCHLPPTPWCTASTSNSSKNNTSHVPPYCL